MTLRIRPRKLVSRPNDASLDLLADLLIGGRRTSRFVSSIRRSQIPHDKRRAEFWNRARARLARLGVETDEIPDRVTSVIPMDDTYKVYRLSDAKNG